MRGKYAGKYAKCAEKYAAAPHPGLPPRGGKESYRMSDGGIAGWPYPAI